MNVQIFQQITVAFNRKFIRPTGLSEKDEYKAGESDGENSFDAGASYSMKVAIAFYFIIRNLTKRLIPESIDIF